MTKNKIGTDGLHDLGNGETGKLDMGGDYTLIETSVISGNVWYGISLYGASSADILSDYIGLNENGSAALSNGYDGILLDDGADGNIIGSASDRNWISGNSWCGIAIAGGSTNNSVDGNYIGVDSSGTVAIPNKTAGIGIFSSDDNTIGSGSTAVIQLISGNNREGVYVDDSSGTHILHSNRIGVAADLNSPIGNGLEGIMLYGATNSKIWASTIAYNYGAGVAVVGNTALGNRIMPTLIHSNCGLPIDLGNDGAIANDNLDFDTGPNELLNYPVLTSNSGSNISGKACKYCIVEIYQALGNPAASAGGGQYLTSETADANGDWSTTLSGGLTAKDVTLTATDLSKNTSEMSPRALIFLPIVIKK